MKEDQVDTEIGIEFISTIEASEDMILVGNEPENYESDSGTCAVLAVTTDGSQGITNISVFTDEDENLFWQTSDSANPLGVITLSQDDDNRFKIDVELLNENDGTIELDKGESRLFGLLMNVNELQVGGDYAFRLELTFEDESMVSKEFTLTM